MIYRSKQGDVLDLICRNYYAGQPYRVESVYDRNPGLAAYGPTLPAGLEIDMPAAEATPVTTIRLWD